MPKASGPIPASISLKSRRGRDDNAAETVKRSGSVRASCSDVLSKSGSLSPRTYQRFELLLLVRVGVEAHQACACGFARIVIDTGRSGENPVACNQLCFSFAIASLQMQNLTKCTCRARRAPGWGTG